MPGIVRSRLSLRKLMAALPADGSPGLTAYRPAGEAAPEGCFLRSDELHDRLTEAALASPTGYALFVHAERTLLALPAFPVERALDHAVIATAPLSELVDRPRVLGVLLLRLGGCAAGVFRGPDLIASKTGRRFVKNRHRKGGQSQRRFERTREKQIDELFDKACAIAADALGPHEASMEHIFLGGDRYALLRFRKQCTYLDRFGTRVMRRPLPIPGDPRHESLEAVPRELRKLEVYTLPHTAGDIASERMN